MSVLPSREHAINTQYIWVSIFLNSPLHLYRHIWACSSDSLTTASGTSSSVILKAIVMAATCPGMAPHIIVDGDPEAVQGKPIGEQGDVGFFGTSCVSSHQERSCLWPSNPRLDGGWSLLTWQSNIYSLTVQPWVGRWRCTVHPPWRPNESCTWDNCFTLANSPFPGTCSR